MGKMDFDYHQRETTDEYREGYEQIDWVLKEMQKEEDDRAYCDYIIDHLPRGKRNHMAQEGTEAG